MVLTSRVPAVSFFGLVAVTGAAAAATFAEDDETLAEELLLAGTTVAACVFSTPYKLATSAESSRMCPSIISGACLRSADLL